MPLQVIYQARKNNIAITPSSSRYYRPIRIRHTQESVEVTNEEVEYIKGKINQLKNTVIPDETIVIKHKTCICTV